MTKKESLAANNNARQFAITCFDSRQSINGRPLTVSWSRLRELIGHEVEETAEKDGLSLVFGEIKPDSDGRLRHRKKQVVALHERSSTRG